MSFSDGDFLDILSNYDLGEFRGAQQFTGGTVQTNYLLTTLEGKFVLKVYENRPTESVKFEANLVSYIQQKDFPCAAIQRNKKGASVGLHHRKPYVIFDFIEGLHVQNLTPRQQRQIIHAAATLQIITKRYKPYLRKFRWNYGRELCYQLAQERAENLGTNNAQRKLQWFETTLRNLHLPPTMPKGICHCDYDKSNILFDGDEFVALIDFDDANYTYLVFDLAHFLNGWAWPHTQEFKPKLARQIVKDYEQTRRLSPLEKRHLFDVHKLGILFDGLWFFKRGHVDGFYERQKIEYLDGLGRDTYYQLLFA